MARLFGGSDDTLVQCGKCSRYNGNERGAAREASVQRAIIKALQTRGCYVVKVLAASRAGVPDLLVCAPGGRFLALEVKAPKGRVSPRQEVELGMARAAGATAAVVRSVADALDALGVEP